MKLNLLNFFLYSITLLITIFAFYYNYIYNAPISVRYFFIEGRYRNFMNLIYILFHVSFFLFFFNKTKDIINNKFCCIGKLPDWIRYIFRIISSMFLARILFITLIFFNSYDTIFVVKGLKNKTGITKDSICSKIKKKYISNNHFKIYYLVLDTLPKDHSKRLEIKEACYKNYQIGDTIKIVYFYKKGVMGYIDYLTMPEMRCPDKCNSSEQKTHQAKPPQKN